MKKSRYHFIGICGISMSALAIYLKKQGHYVQGSDLVSGDIKERLKEYQITVYDKHKKGNITNVDIVVYNNAIKESNEELIEAKRQKLIIISRAQLLQQISNEFKYVLAISGSHGKTSTTKMLYNCLCCAGLNPTLHIGGIVNDGFGLIIGQKEYFVTEACEYYDSFLYLKPDIGVILNIEKEHLDYFKSFKNEKQSFKKFSESCNRVISFDNQVIKNKSVITFGKPSSNICAKNIRENCGRYSFDCYINGDFFVNIQLGAYGRHHINNALAVIGVCYLKDVDKKYIRQGLNLDLNIKRRFETIKTQNNKIIVHDYAHHPTEIQKTLNTFISLCKNRKVMVVFQPHTYSRTKSLFNEFVNCFKSCNNVMLIKTYAAREKYDKSASAYTLYKTIKLGKNSCYYYASFDRAKDKILEYFNKGYNVILLGAGDIEKLADLIRKAP